MLDAWVGLFMARQIPSAFVFQVEKVKSGQLIVKNELSLVMAVRDRVGI